VPQESALQTGSKLTLWKWGGARTSTTPTKGMYQDSRERGGKTEEEINNGQQEKSIRP